MRSRDHGIIVILAFVFIVAGPLLYAAEPEPGVARVSLINGDVTSMRGDSGDWVALTVNAPLVGGDKVATARGARAEVQLDYANILRLGPNSEARIADLSQSRIQVQLSQGVVSLTVLKGSEAEVEIDTPNVAVRPMKEGRYRIQVNEKGETEVIVRKGEADVFTSEGSTKVKKNDMAVVRGTKDSPEYRVLDAPGRDDWDEWNEDRDDTVTNARSWGYTSPYYTGAHDLDRYGRWSYVPGYDWCWAPIGVDPYWAPYRQGRWVWEPYWGWTWVSYEPWGWAPYHYGRWFCQGSSWYWWPGPVHHFYRPYWAPAFVSFFGFGAGRFNFGFGFGFGYHSIGWLPVGPGDYYYPWHGRYRYRYSSVHIVNVRNVYNVYGDGAVAPLGRGRPHGSNIRDAFDNPRLRNSITAVQTDDFVSGRTRQTRIDDGQMRDAQLVAGNPPAVPTRESLRSSDRAITASRSAVTDRSDQMFSRRTPPEVRTTFNEGERAMREMVQRTDPTTVGGRGRSERGPTVTEIGGAGRTQDGTVGAVGRSFDERNSTDSNRIGGGSSVGQGESNSESRGSVGGWQRFGRSRNESRSSETPSETRPATRSDTGRARIETGRGTTDQTPADRPATRSNQELRTPRGSESRGSSESRGNTESRGNSSSGSERRSNDSGTSSRSKEDSSSSTPSRGSSSSREGRGNRGPSDDQSNSRFMSLPRGESGSPRSSGSSVVTIPSESNRGSVASVAGRAEAERDSSRFSGRSERQETPSLVAAPRSQSDSPRSSGPTVVTIPSNRGNGSESRQSQEAPRYTPSYQQDPPGYRQDSGRYYQRETPSYGQSTPSYGQQSPRYYRQETPSYRQESPRSYQPQPRYEAPSRSWGGGGGGGDRSPRYSGGGGGGQSSSQSSRGGGGGGESRGRRSR